MRSAALACVPALLSGAIVLAGAQTAQPEPTLADVLQRAAAYVADFQARISALVVEESYVQDWHSTGPRGRSFGRRETRADLRLLRPAGADAWAEFRDVFEVDGRVIRQRDGGVAAMVRTPASAIHVGTLLAESARFNIGDIERNVNTPLFSLRILDAGTQSRFRFTRAAAAAPAAEPSTAAADGTVFRVSADVWVIAFEEVRAGTLVRTPRRKDQPARGRFWIEPGTGRVLASELVLDGSALRATIDVSFQADPILDMLVPVAMREHVAGKKTGSIVDGRATYSRVRRLEP